MDSWYPTPPLALLTAAVAYCLSGAVTHCAAANDGINPVSEFFLALNHP